MYRYIINTNQQDSKSGNNFEIHNLDNNCGHLPYIQNQKSLGRFSNCHEALNYAKGKFPGSARNIDGCYYCCNDCHRG